MSNLNLLEYALRSLARRWQKQVFLVIIYSLVVAFYASIIFFTSSLKQETQLVLKHIPQLWIQQLAGGRLVPMSESFVDSLSNIRGVTRVIPRIWGYNYDAPTGAVFTIIGSDSLIKGLKMVNTRHPTALESEMTLVGTGFLELRELQAGETITLLDNKGEINSFKVVGTFESESDLLTRDLIILSPKSAKKVLGLKPSEITDVALEISNPLEVDNIARKIDRRFAGIRVVSSEQLESTYQALFSWRGGIFIYGTILAFFAFLILAWERASGLNREEKQELGILKAIGWQINEVLTVKLIEGLSISLVATLTGILLGYLHVFILEATLLKPFLIGWSVLYPNYQLLPFIDFQDILLIFSISVIPYLTATLLPAWKGAITDPADAL